MQILFKPFALRVHNSSRFLWKRIVFCSKNCAKNPIRTVSLSRFLRVILGLCVPQLIVFSGGVGQQVLVGALLDDLTVVEDGDLIAELAGGQPVADVDGRFVPRDLVELGVDLRLGHGVERGGGFIQDDEGRILVQSPRDGDLLRLTAGDGHAALTEYGLVPEEWGGETIVCPISAKTGEGVDNLLENLVLLAEIQELKANPNRAARGTVIEARMDKGRGPIMTVLVQNGTLHQGDIIIAGTAVGRVRTMTNDKGQRVTEAGPSIPVEIAGMSEVPSAGDTFNAVADERMARELVEQRKQQKKDAANAGSKKVSLDDLFSRIQQGEMKDFNIIVKADVQGSAEAVKSSLEKLSNEEVRVQVIHSGVGAISESDVMLAATSNAIIVGFNVRPDAAARDNAARSNVEIRMYRVIYDCINEIEAAMKGMLAPKFQEQIIGHVEIRQTFKVSKVGTVCGGYVTDGKIVRNSKVRVVRDNIVVFEGDLASLRRFKDDVKEVAAGYECGLQVDKYNDVKVGDVIEVFVMQEIKQ